MTVALFVVPSAVGREPEPSPPLADMLRAVGADQPDADEHRPHARRVDDVDDDDLLVPLRLDDHGYSAGGIGLALSVASIMFVGASALTARHAERYATMRLSAVWTLAMAAGIALAALSTSTLATLAFLAIGGRRPAC